MPGFALLQVFLVVLLIAANAFFVAAEFALVSVRDTRIQQLIQARRIGARTVQKLHGKLDELLAAVQLGVTMTSLGLGIAGEATFAHILEGLFVKTPMSPVYIHGVSIILGFTVVTYFHVVLGEIVPKSLALQRAERIALAVSGPMEVFMTIVRPLLKVMSRSAAVVLKIFGTQPMREGGVHSAEELKLMVTASSRVGLLPAFQEDIVHRTLDLENVSVREIMVPRPNIFALPADMPLEKAMQRVIEEQHSRVPVYDPVKGTESIIGLLYSKDLSRFMHFKLTSPASAATADLEVRQVMRDILVVPETKPVSDLLDEFKRKKRHLAVVVDEFGSTTGLVTVEDALEQIVGEIEDEFDVAPQPTLLLAGGALVLSGSENIRDLETRHQMRFPRDEGFETLAGFILFKLGHIPKGGEAVEHEGHRFTVLNMEGHRIAKVKVEATQPRPAASSA
jgi:CBS domain containing-hemolysin-like protein